MTKLASKEATAHYVERLRKMTPAEKLATADELWHTAWQLKMAGEKLRDPSLTEEELKTRVREIFLSAPT